MGADAAAPPGPLRRTVARETAWNTAGAYSALLLNVAVTAVLARVLRPEDFGVVAATLTFTAFFDVLANVSLGGAVLQRRTLTERDLSTLFWFALAASAAAFLLFQLGVSLLGGASTSDVEPALRTLALNVVLVAAAVIPAAVLRSRLRLGLLALSRWVGVVASACVAVPLALAGFGVWALVAQSVTAYAVQAGATLASSRWRPLFVFDRGTLASLFRYTSSASVHATTNYWARNAGHLLIARFAGVAALGEFSLAQRVVSLPIGLLESAFGPSFLPTFAMLGDDPARLRRAYAGFVQVAGMVSFAVAAGLALAADRLVLVLWGPQWTGSVALVLALVPVAAVQPVNAVNGALFLARDDAALLLRVTGLNAAAVLAGMAAGLPWGAAGVAWGYAAAYVLFAAPHAMLTAQHRVLAGTARELAGWLARPVAAGLAVLLCGGAVAALLPAGTTPVVALAALVAASLAGLVAAVRLTAWPLVAPLLARGSVPAVASPE